MTTFTDEKEALRYALREGVAVKFGGRIINPQKRKATPKKEEPVAGAMMFTPFAEPPPRQEEEARVAEKTMLGEIRAALEEMKSARWSELKLRVERDLDTHLIKSISISRIK